jgi:hypothetical protein
MTKRKALPLDSPHWKPLADVHRVFTERLGSPHLAAHDMTLALANEQLRAMARRVTPPARRLLPQEFWSTYRVMSGSDGPRVARLHGALVIPFRAYIFIWEPDVIKFFKGIASATARIEKQLKTPTKPGTRGTPPKYKAAYINAAIKRQHDLNRGWPRRGEREIFADSVIDLYEQKHEKRPSRKYILKRLPRLPAGPRR